MGDNYHLMISEEQDVRSYEVFSSSLRKNIQSGNYPEKDLLNQIQMIHTDVRLDIGIKMNCRHCFELAENALSIAAFSPLIQVHLLNLERFSNKCVCYGRNCVPFVMVNGKYPFFGKRSPKQLIWMIAEVIGKENY